MELTFALTFARDVWHELSPHCDKCDIAGSIRRKKREVKDIEMLVVPKLERYEEKTEDLFGSDATERIRRVPSFAQAVRRLGVIEKGQPETGKYVKVVMNQGTPKEIALDLFIVLPESWGYQMAIRTGSREFSRLLAARWVRMGYVGDEGRLTHRGKPVPVETEEEMFRLLMLKLPPPEMRELTAEGLKPWLL